jgi:predicted permease
LFWRSKVESEMDEEMRFHLESRVATLVSRGMTQDEAARTARVEFGAAGRLREECRDVLGYRPLDELQSDLRYAFRSLRRNPGYSATAIAILAVAIGVNSAFFILFAHHVLKPLPIPGAERHFDLRGVNERFRGSGNWTAGEIELLKSASKDQVEGLYSARMVQVLMLQPAQRLGLVTFVSGNYFRLLGGSPLVGRTFTEADAAASPVAVLSQSGQRRHFPDDPSPIGKHLRVRNTILTVIGVMPPDFTGTESAVPDFWVPADLRSIVPHADDRAEPRYGLSGFLAPGVSLKHAEASLTAAAVRFPRPAGDQKITRVELTSHSSIVAADEQVKTAGTLVFAAFLMVLTIACANLANLCLSRAASRTHEIAMRLSLGASRGRIIRQLLTESTFIALLGAAGGIGIGMLGISEAQRHIATFTGGLGFAMKPIEMDWRVFLFSACMGILAGLAFGLLPAIEVTSPSLASSAKRENSYFAGRIRPRRLRNALIIGQVASSLVLLLIAGVLVRHIQGLNSISTGYDLDSIYDLRLDRPLPAMVALLSQNPGIGSIAGVASVPLYSQKDQLTGKAAGTALPMRLAYNHVDHRYFEVLGLPVNGRMFSAQEASAANASGVVVISEATAQKLWPNAPALGQSLVVEADPENPDLPVGSFQVIGTVPDVISGWLFRGKDPSAVYFPAAVGSKLIDSAMVRINGSPATVVQQIRDTCASTVPGATGCVPTSLREVSSGWRIMFAAAATVAGVLGFLALALTAVGLYSVTSYSVVQRRKEIGVFMALGASPGHVICRILGEAGKCVLIGIVIGLPVCLVLSKLMSSSVFGIRAFDATAYLGIPALLSLITALACAIPARRAAKTDPMESLRAD